MIHLLLGVLLGLFTANFGEYWTHRLLHTFNIHVHSNHHKENISHGWLREYWLYLSPALPVIAVTSSALWFLANPSVSIGWAIGTVLHIGYSAYLHELCHTNPHLLFWMEQPIHYTHHKYGEGKLSNNFSFSTTMWDKLFGTYKPDPSWKQESFKTKEFFSIKWY